MLLSFFKAREKSQDYFKRFENVFQITRKMFFQVKLSTCVKNIFKIKKGRKKKKENDYYI